MVSNLMKLLRLTLVALLLGSWAAPAAMAAQRAATTATETGSRSGWPRPERDAETGWLWIGGGVALFVFMAWVAVRMSSGNDRRPADRVMS